MANNISLGLVIGGAVSSTVGAAFKDVESRVKKLSEQGKKARVLQSTIGETMRLRDEWRKAHAAGEKGAQALLNRLERNLGVLRKEGVEVGRLAKEYDRLGRAGRSAELKVKGHNQISQGKQQVKAGVAQGVVATGLVAATSKVSADYQAIIRDIAIKAGVARSAQEADMSRSIIATSNDIGKEAAHQTERTNLANANSAQILAEQGKRLALEQWLAASDQSHYRALTDEKTKQARLRDRLATADLRLSVQLDAAATGCDGMQATTSPGGVVYGARRVKLDPAHAQRIIRITSDGDQGLIALQACQAYAKEVSDTK